MNNRTLLSTLSLCAALLAPTMASAEPLVRASSIPAAPRAALLSDISHAKQAHPASFEKVKAVRLDVITRDKQKRGGLAPITPLYRALGRDALLPMLAELMDEPHATDMPTSATLAMRLGLLQAIGELRDARAVPVLEAVLDAPTGDARIARTAAAALGNIGSDAAVDALLSRTERAGATRLAVLAGLGSCRRAKAAGALAALLGGSLDDETADVVAGALGDLGNAWAWQTSKVAASGERDVVAGLAASALVRAFVTRDGRVRARAEKSLMLIGADAALVELRAARDGADTATRAAIDALLVRLEKSQLR